MPAVKNGAIRPLDRVSEQCGGTREIRQYVSCFIRAQERREIDRRWPTVKPFVRLAETLDLEVN